MAKRGALRRRPGEEPDFPYEPKRAYRRGISKIQLPDIDVADVRKRLDLSQTRFAHRFGFPVKTLRHWEQGIRKPQGSALALLHVVARYPANVARAIIHARSVAMTASTHHRSESLVKALVRIEEELDEVFRRRV